MLGALLGRLLHGRFVARSPVVRGQLVLLVAVVLLQVAFDLSVPEVSSTAHLIGLLTGLLFGLIVTARRRGALVQERSKQS